MSRPSHGTLWLAGLCGARAGAAMMFMAYPAILPMVQREWQLSGTAAGSISSAFQLVGAVSLAVLSALIDRVGARPILLWSSVASAAVSLSLPLFANGYASALILFSVLAGLLGNWRRGVTGSGQYRPQNVPRTACGLPSHHQADEIARKHMQKYVGEEADLACAPARSPGSPQDLATPDLRDDQDHIA